MSEIVKEVFHVPLLWAFTVCLWFPSQSIELLHYLLLIQCRKAPAAVNATVSLSGLGAQRLKTSAWVHCKLKQCPSVLDAYNTHFLLFTLQIHRSKNKWKFHLKDGIMNLNGRDYVFSKAIGDAEWWSRKRNGRKQQEQDLCNSFYPVNRQFSILPHPVTGFIQETVSETQNSWDKPKGLWGTVKPGCSQKTLD